jgi:hypothetical protein
LPKTVAGDGKAAMLPVSPVKTNDYLFTDQPIAHE